MYGWAWLLRLVIELDSWEDREGQVWRVNLAPLEQLLVDRIQDYLPRLSFQSGLDSTQIRRLPWGKSWITRTLQKTIHWES